MGILKSKGAMLAFMAMAMASGTSGGHWGGLDDIQPAETPERRKSRLEREKIERYKRQGLKEFTIDGKIVWARNEKNAIRKANNIKQ